MKSNSIKELNETDGNLLLEENNTDIYKGIISNTDVYKYSVYSYTTDTGTYNNAAREIGIINRISPALKVQLVQNGIRGEFSIKIDKEEISPAKYAKYLVKEEYDQYIVYVIFDSSCFRNLSYGDHIIEYSCSSANGYTYEDYMVVYISAEGELEKLEDTNNLVEKVASGSASVRDYEQLYITTVNEFNLEDVNWYVSNNDSSKISKIEINVYKILDALKHINNGTRALNHYKTVGVTGVTVKNSKSVKEAMEASKGERDKSLTRADIIKVIEGII